MRNSDHSNLPAGTRFVTGKNSVKEVLRWVPERIVSFLSTREPAVLLDEASAESYQWKKMDFDAITKLTSSDSHQGIAAIVREKPKLDLKVTIKTLAAKEHASIVVISSLQDPHHLGAIFRAAEAFGADLIIWSSKHCSGITAAVTKVAVGATELVPYCEVANINDALRKLKEAGFWIVAAAPGADQSNLSKFEFLPHVAIVLGSEGEGLSRLTLELSDFKVAIEQVGKIDSVSLSQAAAVFLYEIQRQRLSR